MTRERFTLRARIARRIPDPNFNSVEKLEHHIFVVNAKDVPKDLPLEANARRPNTRKQVYREVKRSLMNEEGEPGTFHLKNKGIVIVADEVKPAKGSSDLYEVVLDRTTQGILDGGHTYKLIVDGQGDPAFPDDQYVFIQVRVSVPNDWIADISRGLNTSVQVQDMSLDNLAGRFSWLKDEVRETSYRNEIAWSENDKGQISARDLIALLYLFNIKLFPGGDAHPISGYEKKSEALKSFEQNEPAFKSMKCIVQEILFLYDYIAFTANKFYNEGAQRNNQKGRGGGLSFMREAGRHGPIFANLHFDPDYRLEDAALYPILASFRVFLKADPVSGKIKWIHPFEQVKAAWRDLAYDLIRATLHTSMEVGRSRNAIGKSRLHWDGIFQKVENYKLRSIVGQ